ncbi:flagellar hook-basal body complex protein [Sporosarcina sp. resist]|uniref:flagellar hook-basal body complex protein n=1 Tax=Sporosarcina sp. resist TaxID=2762563 RepID=UPI00164D96F0|nr:flagellar hook-basal body complex protein [Sporosarcina sp. resist]QNK86942.1 flagellar hook-basal body complex protein [Sporosarcina sp. resist]
MLRSMYSGISGLRNFQTKLDVIGNNIANVNTYGFKKGRTIFKDLISQTVAGASGPGDSRGGVNPKQVGLGSQIAAIDTLHTGGSTQFTGNTLDLAVAGDGFFQAMNGNEILYTRAGNFYMDSTGDLVDGEGRYIQGVQGKPGGTSTPPDGEMGIPSTGQTVGKIQIPKTASSMSVGQDGTVYFVDTTTSGKTKVSTAEQAFVTGNSEALLKTAKDNLKAAQEANPVVPGNVTNAEAALVTAQGNYDTAKAVYDKVVGENKAVLQVAGKLQIAKFSNPGGLDKVGGNYFRVSANSGDSTVGFGLDQGFGKLESGFLEMSNVDLAEEFTEMIVAQRGFQANTRIITTSDEILQELVNLKR